MIFLITEQRGDLPKSIILSYSLFQRQLQTNIRPSGAWFFLFEFTDEIEREKKAR